MGRKKIKPEYNPEQIQNELMETVQELYIDEKKSLRDISNELDISVSKVMKLLITAGCYTSDLCDKVNQMHNAGMPLLEIQKQLGISRASVQSYLPYKKGIYNAKEISLNAERIKRYRERKAAIQRVEENVNIDSVWECIVLHQGYSFKTVKGLTFRYKVSGGEIFISRKENSKSITKSTVEVAIVNGMRIMKEEGQVSGPKKLGTFGASYLYVMFLHFGIIRSHKELKN